jgi:hypothetical protein
LTAKSATFSPIYSLVFIEDSQPGATIPDLAPPIAATGSCITVHCSLNSAGPTNFTLGGISEVDPGRRLDFESTISTPSRQLILRTVESEIILDAPVPSDETLVRIWVNAASEPDEVIVGF